MLPPSFELIITHTLIHVNTFLKKFPFLKFSVLRQLIGSVWLGAVPLRVYCLKTQNFIALLIYTLKNVKTFIKTIDFYTKTCII